jgi:hypothetical protein
MEQYHSYEALNQSTIKKLISQDHGIKSREELYYEEKQHFVFGNLVDCLVLTPQSYLDNFYIMNLQNKPPDTVMSIVHNCIDIGIPLEACMILDEAKNYDKRIKDDDKRLDKIIELGTEYYIELSNAKGKQVITNEDYQNAELIKKGLLDNPRTAKYFEKDKFKSQFPIYFFYRGVKCKALLDLVFEEEDGTITILDLKTMHGMNTNFIHSARSFRYGIQAAFYTIAAKTVFGAPINPFKFIATSIESNEYPLIYNYDENNFNIDVNGIVKENGYKILGINDGVDIYKYLLENDLFDLLGKTTVEAYKNDFELPLILY